VTCGGLSIGSVSLRTHASIMRVGILSINKRRGINLKVLFASLDGRGGEGKKELWRMRNI